jgi:hypothetical protein
VGLRIQNKLSKYSSNLTTRPALEEKISVIVFILCYKYDIILTILRLCRQVSQCHRNVIAMTGLPMFRSRQVYQHAFPQCRTVQSYCSTGRCQHNWRDIGFLCADTSGSTSSGLFGLPGRESTQFQSNNMNTIREKDMELSFQMDYQRQSTSHCLEQLRIQRSLQPAANFLCGRR